jgi:hypothetical protein
MFWGGFFAGIMFLVGASFIGYALWKMLDGHIDGKVQDAKNSFGSDHLDVEFLKTDVQMLKNARDMLIEDFQSLGDRIVDPGDDIDSLRRKDECLVNDVLSLEDMDKILDGRIGNESLRRHEDGLAFDKRIRELQDRIDYFIGVSPVGGMLAAKITQEGIAIHKGTDKGAPFDGVTKINDLVTIYEVKYVNDVQWAKIGDNKWICGGWRPRDPKKGFDEKG